MGAQSSPPDDVSDGKSLLAQMRPALLKYFSRKTGSAAEAEDLTQDVIVRALTHANWESAAQAKGYIFRSAVNRWRDRRRRVRTHGMTVAWDEAAAGEADAEISPERVLTSQEELSRVIQALRELSPRTRRVLMLVRLESMKIANVAAALGISVRTVNNDLVKGMAALSQQRDPRR